VFVEGLAPSSAAVASATAVEATTAAAVETAPASATVEAAASITVEACSRSSAVESATGIASANAASITTVCVTAAVATATIAVAASVTGITISATVAIAAAEPGARADEDAAIEPSRAVVAVRGAGVGCVIVVSIAANRRCIPVTTHTDSNCNLGVRDCRRHQENSKSQCYIPKKTHIDHPSLPTKRALNPSA